MNDQTHAPEENPDAHLISIDEVKARLETKVHPRVTEQSIKDKIGAVTYTLIGVGGEQPTATLCVIVMKNGWVSTGFSAPADARNFDPEIGQRYAFDNAFKPLWQLEGYLLREYLSRVAGSPDPLPSVEAGSGSTGVEPVTAAVPVSSLNEAPDQDFVDGKL